MTDTPTPKWLDLAGKATRWTLKAAAQASAVAAEASIKAVELTKAEIERQQAAKAVRAEKARQAEAEWLARQAQEKKEQAEKERQRQVAQEPLIRKMFEERTASVSFDSGTQYETWKIPRADSAIRAKVTMSVRFTATRSLASFNSAESDILKYTYLLANINLINRQEKFTIEAPIIYNSGQCQIHFLSYKNDKRVMDATGVRTAEDCAKHFLEEQGLTTAARAKEVFFGKVTQLFASHKDHPLVMECKDKIIGGTNWLTDHDMATSVFSGEGDAALFLGATEAGKRIWYEQEGSLVSIAPPGSGKTQCHVFPNLLSYRGPAVVLDVKGECFDMTADWRKNNIGPVYKFSPLNPDESARYNPLAFVPEDPTIIWEECRLMADLLIVPENSRDPSWENRARDVLAGVMAWLVRNNPPERRSMGQVIDVLAKIGWETFVEDARDNTDIPALKRIGSAFADMPEKQLEGVLDTARRHLSVWEGARVERVTAACDWSSDVLRDGSNSTIYICIPPNEIESYAPLLRVLFAQHLRQLMQKLPPAGQTPILFMLDELPRLGPMKPVEEALEVGRQYGIRLWMFAQSLGQFEKAYTNAEGMVGSCAVRIFMNPSSHDGTAKRLSEELGYVESIIDGSRHLMVEPTDLTGPDYANYQIVIARNTRPAKLKKIFAYADPDLAGRLPARS